MISASQIEVDRWARVDDWSPNSPAQVKEYLKHKGYRIPKHRVTKVETANEEALTEILRTHSEDGVLAKVVEARHLGKAIGYLYDTYLGLDGRLHPRYTFLPKTGRLSSKAPNIMNIPQGRKGDVMLEVAGAIRGAIIPTPGYFLAEFDWRAIEALLVGYFAGDAAYMRLSKLGVHAYMTCKGVGIAVDPTWDDATLSHLFEKVKKEHPKEYAMFKKTNHAFNYGQGIYNLAKDLQCSVEQAKLYTEIIEKAAPLVAKWKNDTRQRAHKEGRLTTPFGHSLSFFEVYTKRDGQWVLGKEASEVLAYLPQSTGASMLRDVLVDLGEHKDEGTKFNLLVPTHDSVTLEILPPYEKEIMHLVKEVMERKWPELGGLSVETEAKVGNALSALHLYQW